MKQKTDCKVVLLEKQNKNSFKRSSSNSFIGFFVSATFQQFYTLDDSGLAPTIVLHTSKANLINTPLYGSTRSVYFQFLKVADGNQAMLKDVYKLIRAYETDDGMVELSLSPLPHSEVFKVE